MFYGMAVLPYIQPVTSSISILDYDMANLRSVQKALEAVGHQAKVIRTAEDIRQAEKLILPGVGAIRDAVGTLRSCGLVDPIVHHIRSGKPLLGICLGLQMLFEVGYEDGEHQCLGVFAGKCIKLDVEKLGLKVPHMGWNELNVLRPGRLLSGLSGSSGSGDRNVYFVHSYHVVPQDSSIVSAVVEYGQSVVAAVEKDNVMAVQFHPEKSQRVGLGILKRFASL